MVLITNLYPSGRWVPQSETSFLFAFALSGSQLGTILGQLVAGWLSASAWGWPSVFYLSGTVALSWLLPWLLVASDHPADQRFITAEEVLWIEASAANRRGVATKSLPWRLIFTDSAVWAYCYCNFVNSWKFFTLLTCLPQFLKDVLHFDIAANGFISMLPYLGNFLTQFAAGWLADWMIRRGVLGRTTTRKLFTAIGLGSVAVFICAAAFTGCNTAATVAMLVLMLSLGAFNLGGFEPNPLDLSPEHCGFLFALGNSLGVLAGIGAPIVTDLITRGHSRAEWADVFFLTAGIAASGIVVFLLFGSAERRDWGEKGEGKLMSPKDESTEE